MKAIRSLIAAAVSLAAGFASAQMPVALIDATAPTDLDWAMATPTLRTAIECRAPLQATQPVRAVFQLTNEVLDGDHTFPVPLTVFGSLKVTGVSIFHGGDDEGSSYTVHTKDVKMAKVVKAAGLKKDGPRYIRRVKGGLIEAGEPQPGVVQLACIRGGDHE